MSYFLYPGYNHGWNCYKVLDEKTGMVAYSRDVTWHHPEVPWNTPIRPALMEVPRVFMSPYQTLCMSPRLLLHPFYTSATFHSYVRTVISSINHGASTHAINNRDNTAGASGSIRGASRDAWEDTPRKLCSKMWSRWIMRLWCPCWLPVSQIMRSPVYTVYQNLPQADV